MAPPLRRLMINTPRETEKCEPEILRQYPEGHGRMRELTPELQRQAPSGAAQDPTPGREFALANALERLESMFLRFEQMQLRTIAVTYANLMTREGYPVTSAARTYPGSLWGTTGEYVQIYKNETRRPISIQVTVNFDTIAGGGLQLSYGLDNAQAFEVLSSNGMVLSKWILLKPDQQVFASSIQTAIDLTGAVLRVLEFDPVKFFGQGIVP